MSLKKFIVATLSVAFIILIAFASQTDAAKQQGSLGGDIFLPYPSTTFECLVQQGWQYIITRAYHNYGAPDTNAPINLYNAQAAGILYRDIYLYPCSFGVSAEKQVTDTLLMVGQGLGMWGTMWFDLELNPDQNCAWDATNFTKNCEFLTQLIAQGTKMGATMGIYSSHWEWARIFGSSCTVGADQGLPLWYADFDGAQNFSDFKAFGGWTKPNMKQFGSATYCGVEADLDWYPN